MITISFCTCSISVGNEVGFCLVTRVVVIATTGQDERGRNEVKKGRQFLPEDGQLLDLLSA